MRREIEIMRTEEQILSSSIELNLLEDIVQSINNKIIKNNIHNKKWLTISEAAKYAGVSYNTFIKFRQKGLKVCEIDGIKRVSRKEIDRFLEEHSY